MQYLRNPCVVVIALLVLLEVGFRLVDQERLLAYYPNNEEMFTLKHSLDIHNGATDICFMGSSRAKEGIVVPVFKSAVELGLGKEVQVANYACVGAKTTEVLAIMRYIAKKASRPQLIFYGVSPRQFLGETVSLERASIFMDFVDWRRSRELYQAEPEINLIPNLIRNQLSELSVFFKYRKKFSHEAMAFAAKILSNEDRLYTSIKGEMTRYQVKYPEMSLVSRPISDAVVRRYLGGLSVNGRYPMAEINFVFLSKMLALADDLGCRVILFEVPVSDILKKHYPSGTYATFLEKTRAVAVTNNTSFYTANELGLVFTEKHFREQSHLNLVGATMLSKRLAQLAIAEE